ncbi:MAG: hypothetical protein KGI38_07030 [Thaumarchaeota archaeon]|nr:hypothetical protein [Nitrososphaerota archaeon]
MATDEIMPLTRPEYVAPPFPKIRKLRPSIGTSTMLSRSEIGNGNGALTAAISTPNMVAVASFLVSTNLPPRFL